MNILQLGKRIPLIGREKEIKLLEKYLLAPGSGRRYIYFWAHGGLGKTRLLEELEQMVEKAGARFYFSGNIDLYHTDMHSTSDLEKVIMEGLDRKKKYFIDYRQERQNYELLRERGADPGVLEERRQKLGELFVKGCNDMAVDAARLVICFDTIELLQYESSTVEEKAGLDIADTRVKPWLLDKLAQLRNVVVVFAGRPKLPTPGETVDPQARLVADMKKAFGDDFTEVELKPFAFAETCAFLKHFEEQAGQELVPEEYQKVVHRLTGGRPILLHLIVDWLTVLAPESRTILQLFDQYMDLTEVDEDEPRLEVARQDIERRILNTILNDSGEIGGYLTNIALMPKGVDAEILNAALGVPSEEANRLLESLKPLSFIKQYKSPPGVAPLRGEQLFLHDELYRLLTSQNVIPYLRMNERKIANTLVRDYYRSYIAKLEDQLKESYLEERAKESSSEERAEKSYLEQQRLLDREQLQKLQVERLYYMLVAAPQEGYAEYKRLTDQANRHRWVGFAMRLLDEFLRFYNSTMPDRRALFEEVGITNAKTVKESAWMWVERFEWWGQSERVIKLADQILAEPEDFSISCSDGSKICSNQEDLALMGNIYAFWTSSHAKKSGYNQQIIDRALVMLKSLPALIDCTTEQALARARLNTAIGYQRRLGGMLDQAAGYYIEAKAAFRQLGERLADCEDEYAQLLNNLAFVYAEQGRMALALPLVHEALRRNENRGSIYHTGLTLSTASRIACKRGNYARALEYGEEALKHFRDLEDVRGIALAHQDVALAKRLMAKHELEKGRNQEKARGMLDEARHALEQALQAVQNTSIASVTPELHAELGRVYRDFGHITKQTRSFEESVPYYHQAGDQFNLALQAWKQPEVVVVARADTLQDLAEVLFALGDRTAVEKTIAQIETSIGDDYLILPDQQKVPSKGLSVEYFSPLGKVEMLRGQLAWTDKRLEECVQHFIIAYAYFMHFSADAVEKATMLEYLYNHLSDESLSRQQALMETIRTWVAAHNFDVDVGPFVQALGDLLGI